MKASGGKKFSLFFHSAVTLLSLCFHSGSLSLGAWESESLSLRVSESGSLRVSESESLSLGAWESGSLV